MEVMPTSDLGTQQLQQHKTLLDILLADQLITQQQYEEIKVKSASQGIPGEDIVESMSIIPEKKLAEEKAKMLGVPFINLETTSFSPQAISLIPKAVVERFSLIPFLYDEQARALSIAMSNPVDLEALQFVAQK